MNRKKGLTQEQCDYLNEIFGCNKPTARLEGLRVSLIVRKPFSHLTLDQIARRLTARVVSYGDLDYDVFLIEKGLEKSLPEGIVGRRYPLCDYLFLLEGESEYQGRH